MKASSGGEEPHEVTVLYRADLSIFRFRRYKLLSHIMSWPHLSTPEEEKEGRREGGGGREGRRAYLGLD